jgi:nitric oxide reductase NorQ protein
VLKALKPSTRQRFIAIEFDFPPEADEVRIVAAESGLAEARCVPLVVLAARLRALKGIDLEEGCSTRLLVYAATLIAAGMKLEIAIRAAILEPLTDDPEVLKGLLAVSAATLG